MQSILVLGAGRSSAALISYLLQQAVQNHWLITVADASLDSATKKLGHHQHGRAVEFNVHDDQQANNIIASADVVISLLPASFHVAVAKLCLKYHKHLLTASYVSDEMKLLHEEALTRNLLFLNECGLDPGIDHMSAMHVINRVKAAGGRMVSFESFAGGLIAPETDPTNPWRYKFTWNARNVVMAGQGTAKFLQDGEFKYIPYQQLFRRVTQVQVPGYGWFEGYANRDSLKYLSAYGLEGIATMLRGTLRNKGFCKAWHVLAQLGCCDDSYRMESVQSMTHRDFISAFLSGGRTEPIEERLLKQLGALADEEVLDRLRWAGLFAEQPIGLDEGTPAQILETILNKKWQLAPGDKDMIVMWHRFQFVEAGVKKSIEASLVVKGDDENQTAMAKTVGLPLGIAATLLMKNQLSCRGVVIPTTPEVYEPVMSVLKDLGIELTETEVTSTT